MIERMKQIVSKERITRLRTMAWLQSGLFPSRSVHLNRIASKLPGQAKKLSIVRRLERFVANPQVRTWYQPVSAGLLQAAAGTGKPLRLLIASSKVGNNQQLLMVALGYRRRALPLAWTWVRCRRGHRTGHKQCALLAYVQTLVPKDATVIVIGASEFSALQAALEGWGWS